jgi:hypothetical protein
MADRRDAWRVGDPPIRPPDMRRSATQGEGAVRRPGTAPDVPGRADRASAPGVALNHTPLVRPPPARAVVVEPCV